MGGLSVEMLMKTPDHHVTLSVTIKATPTELYNAWTQVDLLERWLALNAEVDLRVGGQYRLENQSEDGREYTIHGEYLLLEPGSRIVQSFVHSGTLPGTFNHEFLDIKLNAVTPRTTELVLIHGWDGQALDEKGLDALRSSWAYQLDILDAFYS